MHETTPAPGMAPVLDAAADTFFVNGQARPWRAGLTVAEVASEAGPPVATSLNGRFVPRTSRASTCIARGDQILVFQPIVGG